VVCHIAQHSASPFSLLREQIADLFGAVSEMIDGVRPQPRG
jgi:hypothetical protein